MYTSIRGMRSASKSRNYKRINSGDNVMAQEKIDGSNFAIMNHEGRLRIFSRRKELSFDDKFAAMPQWCKDNEGVLLNSIDINHCLYGEVLGMGKIGYNSKAGKSVSRLYVFDYAKIALNKDNTIFFDEEGSVNREYYGFDKVQSVADKIGIPTVRIVATVAEFTNELDFVEKYVKNKKSMIDDDSFREGIVVKAIKGNARVKFVSDYFKERV